MTREELNEDIQKEIFQEQNKENIKKIIKLLIKITFLLIIFSLAFFGYTTYISTAKVKVREYRITNEKIPESFNGLKIIQLSDIHFGSTMFNEELKKVIKLINERKPDIVLFTGDLINTNYNLKSKEQEKLIKELKSISSTIGKYAILGNEDTEKVSTIFNQSDFILLRDEYELLYTEDTSPILLVGLNSQKKNQDIDKAFGYYKEETHNSNIYTISIFHEPDTAEDILNTYNADLLLAGHSHNGNIRIPFKKYSLFKVEGAKKYDQDYYKINNSELFVSSGLGTKKGIRLFCRPSINFFRLSNK